MNKPANEKNEKIGLNEIMKRAQEMQKKLQDIQKQVAETEVEGQSGAGLCRVIMTGDHALKKLKLSPELLKEEISVIEDLIVRAANDANAKVEKSLREKMGGLAGLKMPTGFNTPPEE